MMKKNYIYFGILIICTVALTLFLSYIYKSEVEESVSYSYEHLNKITSNEFDEYMIEHPDTIIYIADKTNLNNNKFEKRLINKLEKLNLLENVIYIEKEEMIAILQKKLKENYGYNYNEDKLPAIIVINDGKTKQISIIRRDSDVDTIIDYEVFK